MPVSGALGFVTKTSFFVRINSFLVFLSSAQTHHRRSKADYRRVLLPSVYAPFSTGFVAGRIIACVHARLLPTSFKDQFR